MVWLYIFSCFSIFRRDLRIFVFFDRENRRPSRNMMTYRARTHHISDLSAKRKSEIFEKFCQIKKYWVSKCCAFWNFWGKFLGVRTFRLRKNRNWNGFELTRQDDHFILFVNFDNFALSNERRGVFVGDSLITYTVQYTLEGQFWAKENP
jgi:hypothetical protein